MAICPTRQPQCSTLTFRPTESLLRKGCHDHVKKLCQSSSAGRSLLDDTDILLSELHTSETIHDLAIDAVSGAEFVPEFIVLFDVILALQLGMA